MSKKRIKYIVFIIIMKESSFIIIYKMIQQQNVDTMQQLHYQMNTKF